MMKKRASILIVTSICLAIISCKPKEHVYSTSGKADKKEKHFNMTMGKFNRLLKHGDMEEKYAAAVKYFDKEDYSKAIILFEELMGVYKGTSKAEEISYYFAYCNYNLDDYIIAGYQFRNFVKN